MLLGLISCSLNKNKGKSHGKNKQRNKNKNKKYNTDKVLKRFTLENQSEASAPEADAKAADDSIDAPPTPEEIAQQEKEKEAQAA